MKANETTKNKEQLLVLVDQHRLEYIISKIEELSELVRMKNSTIPTIGEFISEPEAKKLMKKGTTWFWEMRKKGKLTASKTGNVNYYRIEDLKKLIEENFNR